MTCVLFWDIDGTLLSTGRAGVFALDEAARVLTGRTMDLEQMDTAGLTDAEIGRSILEAAGAEADDGAVTAFLREYERHLPDRLHWRTGGVAIGAREILESLRGRTDVMSMLLTGNTRAGAEAKLAHYGLTEFFEHGAFADDSFDRVGIARHALRVASELLGEDASELQIYLIGDTVHDVAGGEAIGARTIAIAGDDRAEALRAAGAWLVLERLPTPERFTQIIELV